MQPQLRFRRRNSLGADLWVHKQTMRERQKERESEWAEERRRFTRAEQQWEQERLEAERWKADAMTERVSADNVKDERLADLGLDCDLKRGRRERELRPNRRSLRSRSSERSGSSRSSDLKTALRTWKVSRWVARERANELDHGRSNWFTCAAKCEAVQASFSRQREELQAEFDLEMEARDDRGEDT